MLLVMSKGGPPVGGGGPAPGGGPGGGGGGPLRTGGSALQKSSGGGGGGAGGGSSTGWGGGKALGETKKPCSKLQPNGAGNARSVVKGIWYAARIFEFRHASHLRCERPSKCVRTVQWPANRL